MLLSGFFSAGSAGYYLLILVFMALLVGLYIWGTSRKEKRSQADQLQEKYKEMDADKLASIPDEELVNAVVANLMAKLNPKKPDVYSAVAGMSHGRCVVYSVWLICHELDEAGFEELFASPSAVFGELAVGAFEELGAGLCATALRKALDAAQDHAELLSELHADFLEAAEAQQPLRLCREYIRDNPSEFVDDDSSRLSYETFDI